MSRVDTPQDVIICDLDGTIALDTHRNHHIAKPKGERDWDTYFSLVHTDEPNTPVIQLLHNMRKCGYEIWILSGRRGDTYEQTIEWLQRHNVPFDVLRMRAVDDRTQDDELKLRWLNELGSERVLFVLEDRSRVVEMWRKQGLACFQVNPGDF